MKSNLIKHAMTYGLFLGLAFSVNFLITTSKLTWVGLLSYIVMAVILYLTYYFASLYRDNECEGAITYGQGLSYIIFLYFFAAIISSIVKFIYFQFINPEYLEDLFGQTMITMESLQIPMADNMTEQIEDMLKPATFSLQYIWINTLLGAIIGLIMAIFIKKEKNLFSEE